MLGSHANVLEQNEVFTVERVSNILRMGLGRQQGRCFIVLENQYGCRDVI